MSQTRDDKAILFHRGGVTNPHPDRTKNNTHLTGIDNATFKNSDSQHIAKTLGKFERPTQVDISKANKTRFNEDFQA